MKTFILSLLSLLLSCHIYGQISGNYQGQLVGANNIQIPSNMAINATGTIITGKLVINFEGKTDIYTLTGTKKDNIYVGKLTYTDGTIFTFKMAQEASTVGIAISYQETIILAGKYEKPDNAIKKTIPPNANNGLTRDQNLIGKWYQINTYTSGGVNSDTYLTFFQDGTMQENTRTTMISYGNNIDVNSIGEFAPNKDIQTAMNTGYRWFSKAGKLCLKAPDGKTECSINYNFDGGYLFIQWVAGAKKASYKRSN
jgi:hypothetical protein